MNTMKIAFIIFLFAASALAQTRPPVLAAACGKNNADFYLHLSSSNIRHKRPNPGKALVYFIQDNGIDDHQHLTLRIGVDGTWVGTYKHNSYFAISVNPGEHHICANVQSVSSTGRILELLHFIAAPGNIYYFRTQFPAGITTLYPIAPFLSLSQIDSDEGQYLIASYPQSFATLKK